jgi:uncharacterized membrane protein YfcA
MIWTVPAGFLAGFVLGFLGAGGTIVALPVLLFLASLPPHLSLGTNALGVSFIAAGLLGWRIRRREVPILHGLLFALAGVPGIYAGARLGLVYPGDKLEYLLGFLLFIVAGWMIYLSRRQNPNPSPSPGAARRPDPRSMVRSRLWKIGPSAFLIGLAAGFFGVGGGFMIVPGLMLAGGLDLSLAVAASLLPIAAFAGVVGIEYWAGNSVRVAWSAAMLVSGFAGGAWGVWLSQHLSKTLMLRIFALFLVVLGGYMVTR